MLGAKRSGKTKLGFIRINGDDHGAKPPGDLNGIEAQAATAEDGTNLSSFDPRPLHGAKSGQACAHQRRQHRRIALLRKLRGKACIGNDIFGTGACNIEAVRALVLAERLHFGMAFVAVAASVVKPGDAGTFAEAPARNTGAELNHPAHALMAENCRQLP